MKKAWSFDSKDSDVRQICLGGEEQNMLAKKEPPASRKSVSSSSATISVCYSLTASSAGDVSSLGADDSNSSQYSHARMESKKKIKSCVAQVKKKFSHPISGQSLQKKLQDTFEIEESIDEDSYFDDSKVLARDFGRFQIADSSLANIQEKVWTEISDYNFYK